MEIFHKPKLRHLYLFHIKWASNPTLYPCYNFCYFIDGLALIVNNHVPEPNTWLTISKKTLMVYLSSWKVTSEGGAECAEALQDCYHK